MQCWLRRHYVLLYDKYCLPHPMRRLLLNPGDDAQRNCAHDLAIEHRPDLRRVLAHHCRHEAWVLEVDLDWICIHHGVLRCFAWSWGARKEGGDDGFRVPLADRIWLGTDAFHYFYSVRVC